MPRLRVRYVPRWVPQKAPAVATSSTGRRRARSAGRSGGGLSIIRPAMSWFFDPAERKRRRAEKAAAREEEKVAEQARREAWRRERLDYYGAGPVDVYLVGVRESSGAVRTCEAHFRISKSLGLVLGEARRHVERAEAFQEADPLAVARSLHERRPDDISQPQPLAEGFSESGAVLLKAEIEQAGGIVVTVDRHEA